MMKAFQSIPKALLDYHNAPNIPLNVWVLGFVSLFTDMGSGVVYSLLPLFLVSTLGTNVLTVGAIEGIAEITAAIAKIFSGGLSDYWQQRKGLAIAGYGLSALSRPWLALASGPVAVLVVYFCDRLGKGIRVAPRDALIADSTPTDQRGAAYGLRQSLDTIGAFLGPLAAFALMAATAQDFRLVFGLTLIPGVLAIGLLIAGIQEPEVTYAPKPSPNPFDGAALGRLGADYWMLLGVAVIASLGNSSNAFLLLRAGETGIGATWIPLTLVVMNITYGLSAYPAGILSDRVNRVGVLLSGLVLFSGVYGGFAIAQSPWQIWGLFALYGLYLGLNKGILPAMIADAVPVDLRGTAFGFFNLVVGLALLGASVLAGGLWQTQGSAIALVVGSGLSAIAALALLLKAPIVALSASMFPVIPPSDEPQAHESESNQKGG